VIPEQAIVVPGAREVKSSTGAKWGLSLYAAIVVKYRDEKTDARVRLEEFLR
jgi:2,3,4,5-tetrahydropyridine-2-carboxylate N-succinyltransferase